MSNTSDFNQKQYNDNFQQYLDSNLNNSIGGGTIQSRINILKKYLPSSRTILEVGSASGDDALMLQKSGYKIIASDYVQEFLNLLKQKNLETIYFDAKIDELPESIDCIYANAVFVHFSPEEFERFLNKAKNKLNNEKIIFISVIKGEGHERNARNRGIERDFFYYTPNALSKLAKDNEYEILYLNDKDPKWIQAILSCK